MYLFLFRFWMRRGTCLMIQEYQVAHIPGPLFFDLDRTTSGLHRLGETEVPVYDGSWTEWATEPDLPMEGEASSMFCHTSQLKQLEGLTASRLVAFRRSGNWVGRFQLVRFRLRKFPRPLAAPWKNIRKTDSREDIFLR
ncbi:unnamed protein product [Brassica rapa]|uniref:Rhodanese domain-containing protein n=1 Tax=Brassica campestris TaxID=3711 RepID=A0A8D9H9F2_BRACM|nr:unnamed protein product [Brassica rapa]